MLHCADRSFYVGHTDNLETRMASMNKARLLATRKHGFR